MLAKRISTYTWRSAKLVLSRTLGHQALVMLFHVHLGKLLWYWTKGRRAPNSKYTTQCSYYIVSLRTSFQMWCIINLLRMQLSTFATVLSLKTCWTKNVDFDLVHWVLTCTNIFECNFNTMIGHNVYLGTAEIIVLASIAVYVNICI